MSETNEAAVESVALSPCPFCGSEKVEVVYCDEFCCGGKPRHVSCECGCELWGEWQTVEQCVARWNTRIRQKCIHDLVKEHSENTTSDF